MRSTVRGLGCCARAEAQSEIASASALTANFTRASGNVADAFHPPQVLSRESAIASLNRPQCFSSRVRTTRGATDGARGADSSCASVRRERK